MEETLKVLKTLSILLKKSDFVIASDRRERSPSLAPANDILPAMGPGRGNLPIMTA